MSLRFSTARLVGTMGLSAAVSALGAGGASAADWVGPGGLSFYDAGANWSTGLTPTAATDVVFDGLLADPQIILGANSRALDVDVLSGAWTFTGSGVQLDSEGFATIDDTSALDLSSGARLSLVDGGAGVTWDVLLDLLVGDAGYGTLDIGAGTGARARDVFIGNQLGSFGEVNVDGAGAALRMDGTAFTNGYFIGNSGTGTLNVTNGGLVEVVSTSGIPDLDLGFAADGEGTLLIDGTGSRVFAEDVFIGNEGTGHLTISGGGFFDQSNGNSADGKLGFAATGTGDAVVTGDGSLWAVRRLDVGQAGSGSLSIEAGAVVRAVESSNGSNGDVLIGTAATGDGIVAVHGLGAAASLLDVDDNLYVGLDGHGVLNVGLDLSGAGIGSGQVLVDIDLRIGTNAGNAFDNRMTVRGSASSVDIGGGLFVGDFGRGTLTVIDLATINAGHLRVGQNTGSNGAMTIRSNASVDIAGSAAIGNDDIGSLIIDSGSTLNIGTTFWVGFDDGSGTVILDGVGTSLRVNTDNAADTFIGGENGQTGGTGTVIIQNGALMTTQRQLYIGGNATGTGTVSVTGVGSLLDANDNGPGGTANEVFYVGFNGTGQLNINDGGRVESELVRIGEGTGGAAAGVLLSGVNGGALPGPGDDTASSWDILGDLVVGTNRLATLTIEQGAVLDSQTGPITTTSYIGFGAAADGASATVTGAGSQWNHRHHLAVGRAAGNSGAPAQLNILDGGYAEATYIAVATADGSYGVINVDGAGSTLRLVTNADSSGLGDLRLVSGGSNGDAFLKVTNGGRVDLETHLEIGRGDAAGDARIDVIGPGSQVNAAGELTVAYDNSTGFMFLADGGAVTNAGDAFISRFDGTGTAFIGAISTADTGHAQATWTVGTPTAAANLYVAGRFNANATSGVGTLTINPTGRVTVNGMLRVWDRGVVNLEGGTLEVDSLLLTDSTTTIASSPTFNFNSGTLRYIGDSGTTLDNTQLPLFLGTAPTLTTSQHLAVENNLSLTGGLRLSGGILSVGTINAASIANLDFDAGTFNLTASDMVVGTGGLFGENLTITNAQTVNVSQTVNVQAGRELVVVGGYSAGHTQNNGNLVVVSNAGTRQIAGTLNTPAGSTVTLVGDVEFLGQVSGAGGFFGPGTAIFTGGYAPGDSPAVVGFEGGARFTANNILGIEIAGTGLGSFDRLIVADQLDLAGDLEVTLLGGYTPTAGDRFDLLDWGTLTGTFDDMLLPTLTGGLGWDTGDLYLTGELAIIIEQLTGDYTGDGFVGVEDLDILLANWGDNVTPGDLSLGDGNGDGVIGSDDLAIVQANWGNGTPGGGNVPEPGTLAVLAVGVAGLAGRRRGRCAC